MSIPVRMPLLGETVSEGTITKWLRHVGDEVVEGEPLFEVSTDKVDSDVEAPASGTLLAISVAEGETVAVGETVATLSGGDDTEEPAPAPEPAQKARTPLPPAAEVTPPAAAPVVAAEVVGPARTTRPGAMTMTTSRFPALPPRPAAPAPSSTLQAGAAGPAAGVPSPPRSSVPAPVVDGGRFEPYTPIRRTIGARMTASQRTAAHTLVIMEADYEAVHRARLEARRMSPQGGGLTYLPFVLHAITLAIPEFPTVNAHVSDEGTTTFESVHLGVAVDLDHRGLVVPVIRDAETLRLMSLARAANDVAESARAGALKADDLNGGTITVTNPGGFGTLAGAPILNPPQAAIVETDSITRKVVVEDVDGEVFRARRRGNLSMSYDHRAFDGAYASAFLRRVCEILRDRDWSSEVTG